MASEKTLKEKVESVIRESYKKAKEKKFVELNFVFPKGKSETKFLNQKLELFKSLDEYSQTFLSIHTKAKITLREFKDDKFEGAYLELLRLILTLPDTIAGKNLKSVKVTEKQEVEIINKEYKKENKIENLKELKNGTILVKEGLTGKKIQKQKEKEEQELEELQSIEFEFSDEEENYENIKFDD